MKKTNPMLLWVVLWIAGMFFITARNRIVKGDVLMGELITANLVMDIVIIPVVLVAYFVIKMVADVVGAKQFLQGSNGLRNIVFVWVIIFVLFALFPLFK